MAESNSALRSVLDQCAVLQQASSLLDLLTTSMSRGACSITISISRVNCANCSVLWAASEGPALPRPPIITSAITAFIIYICWSGPSHRRIELSQANFGLIAAAGRSSIALQAVSVIAEKWEIEDTQLSVRGVLILCLSCWQVFSTLGFTLLIYISPYVCTPVVLFTFNLVGPIEKCLRKILL